MDFFKQLGYDYLEFEKQGIISPVIGLKEITFLSALTDLVIIEQFVSRIIQKYYELPIMNTIDAYVPLGVGIVLLIIPVIMFIRSIRYKA